MIAKVNLDFIHKGWTFNLTEDRQSDSIYPRIKTLILSLLKTDDIEQFLRVVKQFYINNSKKIYSSLIDYIMAQAIANPADVKNKKEVFKHINE